jgi:PPOX class probable F420-dependent enzyme
VQRGAFEADGVVVVASGACKSLGELPENVLAVLETSRRAALATVGDDGVPHVVPVCFAILGDDIVSAVDQKPKSSRMLARVRNVRARPSATMLFDRWDEDWSRLGWVMVSGTATISSPGTGAGELRARYAQYEVQPPAGEVIVVRPERIRWWLWS